VFDFMSEIKDRLTREQYAHHIKKYRKELQRAYGKCSKCGEQMKANHFTHEMVCLHCGNEEWFPYRFEDYLKRKGLWERR